MITKDRQYRTFEIRADEQENRVDGYAAVFDSETVMYEYDGIQYKEVIARNAFNGAQMQDVVLEILDGGRGCQYLRRLATVAHLQGLHKRLVMGIEIAQ